MREAGEARQIVGQGYGQAGTELRIDPKGSTEVSVGPPCKYWDNPLVFCISSH
jgi:hypothetical protein